MIIKINFRDFPGGPLVKTVCFHCRGYGFHLRPHRLHGVTKKKKKINIEIPQKSEKNRCSQGLN